MKKTHPKTRRPPTSRPLHRRIALHPVSVLTLLCVGVLLGGMTFRSFADSYDVSAIVEAAPLTEGAVITSPADQSQFTTTPIMVSGTCPSNSYVELSRNGVLAGTAICGPGQTTFQIQTDLLLGSNTLSAQDFNDTNQPGPATPSITVYYNPPSTGGGTPGTSGTSGASGTSSGKPGSARASGSPSAAGTLSPSSLPFFITTDFRYLPIASGQPFKLDLTLDGGTAPYAVTVDWGDGKQATLVRTGAGQFAATHTYSAPVANQRIVTVKIQGTDSTGRTAFLQVAELVHGPHWYPGAPLSTDAGNPNPPAGLPSWLHLIWPVYGIIVLMVLSFWLGERQEYDNLFRPRRQHRPRPS